MVHFFALCLCLLSVGQVCGIESQQILEKGAEKDDTTSVGGSQSMLDIINAMQQEMSSLKAEVNDLKAENIHLKTENMETEVRTRSLEADLNHLKGENLKLAKMVKANVGMVGQKIQQFQSDIVSLKAVQNNFVAFTAYAKETRNYDNDERVVFDGVVRNYGGHYDNITYVFNCPSTGYYLFSFSLMTYNAHISGNIRVNGQGLVSAYANDASMFASGSNSVVTLCEAGQYVDVVCTSDGRQLYGSDSETQKFSTFSGVLLQLIIE